MTTLGQFRRSFSTVYPNLYFRVGENKYNDKTLLSELSNTNNPIVDWNEFATATDIKEIIEAWLNLGVDFYFEKAPGSRPRYIKIEEVELATPIADLNEKVVSKGAVDLTYWAQGQVSSNLNDNQFVTSDQLLIDFPQLHTILNSELIDEMDNISISIKESGGYSIKSSSKTYDDKTSYFIDLSANQLEISFSNIQTVYAEINIDDEDFIDWFSEDEEYGLHIGRHLWNKFIDVFDDRRNESDTEFENDFVNNFIWEFINVVFHPFEG